MFAFKNGSDIQCVSSCANDEFIMNGSSNWCASCQQVSNSVYLFVNSTYHQCTNCTDFGMFIHSDNVCNTTNCLAEASNIFNNNGKCASSCPYLVDSLQTMNCVSTCKFYIPILITNNSININQSLCQASCPSTSLYIDNTTKINGVSQCVSICPSSVKYAASNNTCISLCNPAYYNVIGSDPSV